MNKLMEWLRNFMSGRYGLDLLGKVLMGTAFAAVIAGRPAAERYTQYSFDCFL